MPTLAAGNKGFTLIELLVVLAIIAIGTAGVSLSMRDSAQSALERDAQRLAALLDSARARSRATGVPVVWRTVGPGTATGSSSTNAPAFVFDGLSGTPLPQNWLDANTQALNPAPLWLGPEPIIGAQAVALTSAAQTSNRVVLWVATDGLRPFGVETSAPPIAGGRR